MRRWLRPINALALLVLGYLASIAGNYLTRDDYQRPWLLEQIRTYPAISLGIVCAVSFGLYLLDRRWERTEAAQATAQPPAERTPLSPADRIQLLQVLSSRYRERIQASLGEAVRLELGFATVPEFVRSRLHDVIRSPLPTTTAAPDSIVAAFFGNHRQLLIIGAPGAGKTFTLIELAHGLTHLAQEDPRQPIPFILNLASWRAGQTMREWAAAEIVSTYGTSKAFARQIVASPETVLLLDGLDELAEPLRAPCIAAINVYREPLSGALPQPLVVACREREYGALNAATPLLLGGAVRVEPLDLDSVIAQLRSERRFAGVVKALRDDTDLISDPESRALIATPLFLSMFLLAFVDRSVPSLRGLDADKRRGLLFRKYIPAMLRRRPLPQWLPMEQGLRWLRALAVQLRRLGETNFVLDEIQPDAWLSPGAHVGYRLTLPFGYLFVGAAFGGIIGFLVGGMTGGMLAANDVGIDGFLEGVEIFGFTFLQLGSCAGAILGAVFGCLKPKINLAEHLVWQLTLQVQNVRALVIGSVFGGLLDITFTGGRGTLASVLLAACMGGSVGFIWSGFYQGALIHRVRPEQGVWVTLWKSLMAALLTGVGLGVSFAVLSNLLNGVLIGVLGALCIGLLGGFGAWLKHWLLRLFLARDGTLPWRVVPVYDALSERLLLERDGGVYRFRHILLRDYIAGLSDAELMAIAVEVQAAR